MPDCVGWDEQWGMCQDTDFSEKYELGLEEKLLGMFPRIGKVTPNVREKGSESLCVKVRKTRRCHVWVELWCTWLEP